MKIRKTKTAQVGITTSGDGKKYLPYELNHVDRDGTKRCWFVDEYDMKKYIERYKLKPKTYQIVIHKVDS